MANPDLAFGALLKSPKGAAMVKSRVTRRKRVSDEQKAMQAALKRDGRKCRRPRCEFAPLKLTVDPCHMVHRGMGGNPKGDRTTRATVIALCRRHHGMYDKTDHARELRIEPLTPLDFDGVCEFYETNPETGKLEHVGTEKRIGVSVVVGR